MKHQLFAIFDQKAHAYLPPFAMHHKDMALRLFSDCINDQNHQFGRNPADYDLFGIGEYDDGSGTIEPHPPKYYGNGLIFRRSVAVEGQMTLPTLNGKGEEHDHV